MTCRSDQCNQGRQPCPTPSYCYANLAQIDDFRPPAGYPPLNEQNEAQEAADKPVTPSVGEMALVALIVVPVVGVVGWFLFSNAPILYALLVTI